MRMRADVARAGLFLALFCTATGQSFLHVVLPPLGRQLGFTDMQTGLILTVSALLIILTAPIWGYVSERAGRRPVILVAVAAATVASFSFALIVAGRIEGALTATAALALFFVVRSMQMAACSGLQPATQAYIADTTSRDNRARGMGVIGAAYGFGAVAGAVLAWLVASRSVPAAFGCLGAMYAVTLLCVIFAVPEPGRDRSRQQTADGSLRLGRIWPFLVVTLTGMTAYSIVYYTTALRLQDAFGLSSGDAIARAGAALMATALAMGLIQSLALRYLAWKPERLATTGAVLAVAALLLCSLARSYAEITGSLALFGAALGLMLPGNLASLSLRAGEGAQGKVAGVNVVAQGLGLAIGPMAGATIHQISFTLPLVAAAGLMGLSALFAALGWSQRQGVSETTQTA